MGIEKWSKKWMDEHKEASMQEFAVALLHKSSAEPHLHGVLAPLSRIKAPLHKCRNRFFICTDFSCHHAGIFLPVRWHTFPQKALPAALGRQSQELIF